MGQDPRGNRLEVRTGDQHESARTQNPSELRQGDGYLMDLQAFDVVGGEDRIDRGRRNLRHRRHGAGQIRIERGIDVQTDLLPSENAEGGGINSLRSAAHMQNGSGSKQAMGHSSVGWVDGISVAQGLSRRKPPSAALR